MTTHWVPTPGMVALLEPTAVGREQDLLTGVVLPDDRRVLVDLGASPGVAGTEDVVASFFASDALYRLRATATPTGSGSVVELDVLATERVQRRAEPRTRVTMPVTVGGGGSTHLEAETIDVAGAGCRIATDRPLPAGADATLTILLPEADEPVVVEARVLEVIPTGDHWEERLSFVSISDDAADLLRHGSLTN